MSCLHKHKYNKTFQLWFLSAAVHKENYLLLSRWQIIDICLYLNYHHFL